MIMFATAAATVVVVAKNKKKRKRPRAKDWPPTSTQKKTLVPYGRPRKLPRLDESPYKEVWIKIVRLTLMDLQGYKGCCRKMKYFKDVHRELVSATTALRHTTKNHRWWTPLQITKQRHAKKYGKKYPSLEMYSRPGPTTRTGFDLGWTPYEGNIYIEKLVWINPKMQCKNQGVTHLSRNRPYNIIRFTRASRWEAFICDYMYGRIKNGIRLGTYKHSRYNEIGCSALKYLIRMAPNYLDRSAAKRCVCELISLHGIGTVIN